eukprot:7244057-Karenia_brevis.AAC.1
MREGGWSPSSPGASESMRVSSEPVIFHLIAISHQRSSIPALLSLLPYIEQAGQYIKLGALKTCS